MLRRWDEYLSGGAMARYIRFGNFVRRKSSLDRDVISYNALAPKVSRDADGRMIPYVHPKVDLRPTDIFRLLRPYAQVRFNDQLKAVVPLAVYLALFQLFILRKVVDDSWIITAGLFAVIVGLMCFMEGLKLGLMPFGETIGNILPRKSPLPMVLLVAFILGVGVTFAEPAIGALKAAGAIVSVEKAPYLYSLLNNWSDILVLVVGAGVGLAAVLGTLRFMYGWSLKPLIYTAMVPTIGLTLYAMTNPELEKVIGLAWDSGAVTTGPVTVPLVLSLGIGIAAAAGKAGSPLSGFGIVTLASIFPIIGVLLLAVVVAATTTPDEIIAAAKVAAQSAVAVETPWYERTPGVEVITGLRSIVPLILFLLLIMKVMLREQVKDAGIITYGIVLAVLGMIIFNLGLTYGLAKLGSQSGGLVPAAFLAIDAVEGSPLYVYALGIFIAVGFAWVLGFGATLAEPALNALGATVETLTQGVFKKSTLMYAVSTGVAFGLAIGLAKIIYDPPLVWLLIPGYTTAIILTYFSSEEFVNIAWDSAGVTTGPITVPLVLAMGLGFGSAVGAVDGFGILSMASICPILAVLITGLWVRYRASLEDVDEAEAEAEAPQVEVTLP